MRQFALLIKWQRPLHLFQRHMAEGRPGAVRVFLDIITSVNAIAGSANTG
jgi:hypothetical protein